MTAPAERNAAVNVGGTTHAVELARSLEAGRLHHVSSIAVAGAYRGTFTEEMFDEGRSCPRLIIPHESIRAHRARAAVCCASTCCLVVSVTR